MVPYAKHVGKYVKFRGVADSLAGQVIKVRYPYQFDRGVVLWIVAGSWIDSALLVRVLERDNPDESWPTHPKHAINIAMNRQWVQQSSMRPTIGQALKYANCTWAEPPLRGKKARTDPLLCVP